MSRYHGCATTQNFPDFAQHLEICMRKLKKTLNFKASLLTAQIKPTFRMSALYMYLNRTIKYWLGGGDQQTNNILLPEPLGYLIIFPGSSLTTAIKNMGQVSLTQLCHTASSCAEDWHKRCKSNWQRQNNRKFRANPTDKYASQWSSKAEPRSSTCKHICQLDLQGIIDYRYLSVGFAALDNLRC